MQDSESNLILARNGSFLETASLKGLQLGLLTGGDGTELIYHRLTKDSHWGLSPLEGWTALEAIYIVSGTLRWQSSQGNVLLQKGDVLSSNPVKKDTVFVAETDCEFLYITSQPVFHYYSRNTKQLFDLAVEIEQKDGNTADHCHRIMELSMMVGKQIGLTSTELLDLNFGSFLHDVGKVEVPGSILGKPGQLTDEEWTVMRLHTVYGSRKLHETGLAFLQKAGTIVERHHERFDGSGYPHSLKGSEIDICSAIVAVVDSYDAMTTKRVYQNARSKEEALTELERSRDKYHPDILQTFFKLAENSSQI